MTACLLMSVAPRNKAGPAERREGEMTVESGSLALEMAGISKSFPGVRALDDVNFACAKGEVHAL